ncbi:hypothetical protein EZL74_08465 [Flavobacterium silvisoli]|uniref:Uncharacterized protein n=1 Tax=Flavobacterium silvisoli TaxID=2529433 RepID=A0A4Q9YXB5_9FLAO|nr:hypothetical protein [Flavobacterium silvisoli]TBX68334.1 hypothetical protein EZL74_08465 [Flavobacterium silvisoli]
MKLELTSKLNNKNVIQFQKEVLREIEIIFSNKEISNFRMEEHKNKGVRGKYEDNLNLMIVFYFKYKSLNFEFYIHYDQLEFYILIDTKVIRSFIIEDFDEDKKMIGIFKEELNKALINFCKSS